MSEKMVFVKPREGLKVVNPNSPSRFIPSKGIELPETPALLRAVRFGDLILAKHTKKSKDTTHQPKSKKADEPDSDTGNKE